MQKQKKNLSILNSENVLHILNAYKLYMLYQV